MSDSKKIRLFIIDDHQIVINGIEQALTDHPEISIVGTALSAEEGQEKLNQSAVDVVLLDVMLPGMDGLELCKILRKEMPKLKIIGLTTFGQVSFIAEMLRNGAHGYLFKNTSEQELSDAIKSVHVGDQYLSKEVNQRLLDRAMNKASQNFIPKLTRREKEILDLIMEENTNQEIAKDALPGLKYCRDTPNESLQ